MSSIIQRCRFKLCCAFLSRYAVPSGPHVSAPSLTVPAVIRLDVMGDTHSSVFRTKPRELPTTRQSWQRPWPKIIFDGSLKPHATRKLWDMRTMHTTQQYIPNLSRAAHPNMPFGSWDTALSLWIGICYLLCKEAGIRPEYHPTTWLIRSQWQMV